MPKAYTNGLQMITQKYMDSMLRLYCPFRGAEPPYTILQEPIDGHPEYLVAEFHLPKVVSDNISILK